MDASWSRCRRGRWRPRNRAGPAGRGACRNLRGRACPAELRAHLLHAGRGGGGRAGLHRADQRAGRAAHGRVSRLGQPRRHPPDLVVVDEARCCRWTVARPVAVGAVFEYELDAVVLPTLIDLNLESHFVLARRARQPGAVLEAVEILGAGQGQLPAAHAARLSGARRADGPLLDARSSGGPSKRK